jgi:hypothetical protein
VVVTITLAFHHAYGITTEPAQRVDVERQAREWAAAEPKVTGCRIVKSERTATASDLWAVTVELSFIEDPQPTLWGVS